MSKMRPGGNRFPKDRSKLTKSIPFMKRAYKNLNSITIIFCAAFTSIILLGFFYQLIQPSCMRDCYVTKECMRIAMVGNIFFIVISILFLIGAYDIFKPRRKKNKKNGKGNLNG